MTHSRVVPLFREVNILDRIGQFGLQTPIFDDDLDLQIRLKEILSESKVFYLFR